MVARAQLPACPWVQDLLAVVNDIHEFMDETFMKDSMLSWPVRLLSWSSTQRKLQVTIATKGRLFLCITYKEQLLWEKCRKSAGPVPPPGTKLLHLHTGTSPQALAFAHTRLLSAAI